MRILELGGNYKPNNGGNAKRISTMSEQFVNLGHSVTVFTNSGYDKNGINEETINGVNVVRFENSLKQAKKAKIEIENNKFDALLIHYTYYFRKLKLNKIPTFYEVHAIEDEKNIIKRVVRGIINKYCFKKYISGIFVLSNRAKEKVCKLYGVSPDKVFFTPNGLEKNKQYEVPAAFGKNKSFIYGYGGTLYEFQGIKMLLRNAKKILEIADDVKIMIVGDGPLKNEVDAFAIENNLSEKVIVTGAVPQEKFDEYMEQFDVVLMPRPSTTSTESTIPLKIFDAAIHQKPVVMSNVLGLTEAFGNDAALIYPHQSDDDFVECCKKIYRNEELAASLVRGERKALENWPSVEDVAKIQLGVMEREVINFKRK